MNIQKNGINLLLVAEVLLLAVVLVLGLLSGVTGAIRDVTDGPDSEGILTEGSENTEETDSTDVIDTEGNGATNNGRWSVPEDYSEGRVTFSANVEEKLAAMTTEQKVAQLFIVTPEELTGYNQVTIFGNASKTAMDKYPVGGFAYNANNYQGTAQFESLIRGAKDYSTQQFGYTLFAIVEETLANTEGVDVSALENSGINVAVKCFMSSELNGDETLEELSNTSFSTYQESIDDGIAFIVVGNAMLESITDDENVPCTLSNRVVGLLRESMGYDGLLITDSFSESGFVLAYGNGPACVEAIKAGMDMIYMPSDFEEAYNAVLQAVNNGNISADRLNNAVGRILTAKGV